VTHDEGVLKRSQAFDSRVREYFIEVGNLCELDVGVLLTGTGRLSRILQKDNVQEQRTSRDISPSTEQDLARSASPDAAPNDAINGYQASSSAPSGEAWGGEIQVTNITTPPVEVSNKCTRANGGTSAPANACDSQPEHQQNQSPQSLPHETSTTRTPLATNCMQPDAELARQHRTNLNTPVTAQRYTSSLVTTTTPLSNQAGTATPDTTDRYTLQAPPFLHAAMQRPEVGIASLPPLSGRNQEVLGCYRAEEMQYLEHQLQPNVEIRRHQDAVYQTAMFGSSTNGWIQIPDGAGEASCQPGSTNRPGLHVQTPVPMTQGLGWDGTSYDAQVPGLDPRYWLNLFPSDMHN